MNARDEFFIGWEARQPQGLARHVRAVVITAFVLGLLIALAAIASHGPLGNGRFEFGTTRSFRGIVLERPVPQLLVERPGGSGAEESYSRWLLVTPGKHGAGDAVRGLSGRRVTVDATLIYRGGVTMLEIVPETLQTEAGNTPALPRESSIDLGQQSLIGEIVDSKCWLGVMNPGHLKTHRGCAVRCISGGSPPILIVRHGDGPVTQLLLTGPEGRSIARELLDVVAEPVLVTGRVSRVGEMLVLEAKRSEIVRWDEPR